MYKVMERNTQTKLRFHACLANKRAAMHLYAKLSLGVGSEAFSADKFTFFMWNNL